MRRFGPCRSCPDTITSRPKPWATKPPYDPATRPKFRVVVEAINTRSRELGLIEVNEDPDQAAFIRRRQAAQLSETSKSCTRSTSRRSPTQSSALRPTIRLSRRNRRSEESRNSNQIQVPLLQVVDKGEKIRYDENAELTSMLPQLGAYHSFLGSPVFRLVRPTTPSFG